MAKNGNNLFGMIGGFLVAFYVGVELIVSCNEWQDIWESFFR